MTCLAAWPLGVQVAVLGGRTSPPPPMAAGLVEGDWRDADAVRRLGAACGVVTLENEFVDAAALAAVQAAGTPVRPDAGALGTVQDKALQKGLLRDAGLPTAPFRVVEAAEDLAAAGRDLGWPLMLKARRLGYDGYGNATCADEDEAREALARLDSRRRRPRRGGSSPSSASWPSWSRAPGGAEAAYPVVETVQANHVCHEVVAPAPIARRRGGAGRRGRPGGGGGGERPGRDRRGDVPAARRRGAGQRAAPRAPTTRATTPSRRPRPPSSRTTCAACSTCRWARSACARRRPRWSTCSARAPGRRRPTSRARWPCPARTCTSTTRPRCGPGRKMGHVTALGDTAEDALARARRAAAAVGL